MEIGSAEPADTPRDWFAPLDGVCSAQCAVPNARTNTGRRCSLYSCIEFQPEAHFSHSNFCPGSLNNSQFAHSYLEGPAPTNLQGVQFSSSSGPAPAFQSAQRNCNSATAMPRLRPRMTARRGGSRGRSADDRSFPSRHGMDFNSASHGQRSSSPQRAVPLDPASSGPPPPRNLFTRYTTQRAQLHFESVFNRPSITAHITVTLCEEASLSSSIWPGSPSAPHDPSPSPLPPRSSSAAMAQTGPSNPSDHLPHSPDLHPLQVRADSALSTDVPIPDAAEDDPDAYFGCPIVEEHPSPGHTN